MNGDGMGIKNHENQFPPKTFSELRRIPMLIQRDELDLPMGKQTYRALCSMMDDPQLVALNNISSLARSLKLSPASLTRLAKLLGFKGFPQLQNLFKSQLTEPDNFYSSQAQQLVRPDSSDGMVLLKNLADECKANIGRGLEQIEAEQMESAVEWLANSLHVHVSGYRQSAALASAMSYGLSMIRRQVYLIGAHGHGLSIGLSQIRERDLLVLFSSSPYSRETVMAAKLAKQQRTILLAITDSHLSPLAQWADVTLMVPTQSQFYSNSFVAMMFMVEGLLTLTARKLGSRAVRNLKVRESYINILNDEY